MRHGLAVPRAGDRSYETGSIRGWSRSHSTYLTGGCWLEERKLTSQSPSISLLLKFPFNNLMFCMALVLAEAQWAWSLPCSKSSGSHEKMRKSWSMHVLLIFCKLLTGFRMHALLPAGKSVPRKQKPCACPQNQSNALFKLLEYHKNIQRNPSISASRLQLSDGRQNSKLDTCIGKASAVMGQLHRSVVLKLELCTNQSMLLFYLIAMSVGSWMRKWDLEFKQPIWDFCEESAIWPYWTRSKVQVFVNL